MGRLISIDTDAKEKIFSASQKLANIVGLTMGPAGGNVLLGKFPGAPTITKDGVSVAREVVLDNPLEDAVCKIIKEVAGRTADIAGDGTTTATVLADAILQQAKLIMKENNISPISLREGFQECEKIIISYLRDNSKELVHDDELRIISTISANNDSELGSVIAEAFIAVNREGSVLAEAYSGEKDSIRYTEGVEIQSGYNSELFLPKGETSINFSDCYIFVSDMEITDDHMIGQIMNEVHNSGKPIVLFAKKIRASALAFIVQNVQMGKLKAACVENPSFGPAQNEWLNDLALLCGTKLISEDNGVPLKNISLKDLGSCKSININKISTKIKDIKNDKSHIESKASLYREALKNNLSDSQRTDIKKRLAFLQQKTAVIQVSYATEAELREKGDRIEDAVCALKTAISGGILPGGGVLLLRIASKIKDLMPEKYSDVAQIMSVALKKPFYQIMKNGHKNAEEIEIEILKSEDEWFGYNLKEERFGNLYSLRVLDPCNVTVTALQNAISIATILINCNALIVDDPEHPAGWQPPAGWRPNSQNNLNHKY